MEEVKHGILSFVGQSWLGDTFPDIFHNMKPFTEAVGNG